MTLDLFTAPLAAKGKPRKTAPKVEPERQGLKHEQKSVGCQHLGKCTHSPCLCAQVWGVQP